ncbi:MAG: type VII toxin-antitoxin system MntA family adenylyltransferase antitoxin [Deferrisomatales bacterium]
MPRRINWNKTVAIFEKNPRIVAAWGFGSAQSGMARAGGDVDVGVLFSAPPDLDELADLREALQTALDFDDVDLVPLNRASPALRFEVVSGRRLYCRDPGQRAAFVSLVAREHEDERAFYRRAFNQSPRQSPDANAFAPITPRSMK